MQPQETFDGGEPIPDRGLKTGRRHRRFGGRACGSFPAETRHVGDRFISITGHRLPARIIMADVKTSMHDADQRNELAPVVFYEQDVFITNRKCRGVGNCHRFAVNCSAKHSHVELATRFALETFLHVEGDVTHDVALRAFADPLRFHLGHLTLKNGFGLVHQLFERRWNNCRGVNLSGGEYQRRMRTGQSQGRIHFFGSAFL